MKTNGKIKTAIGIISYNNDLDGLERLLVSVNAAVENAHDAEFVVLCVDNGIGVFSEISEQKYGFVCLPTRGNVGFARMSNLLMEEAFDRRDCDAYICLNPDGLMHRSCLSEMALVASQNPTALVEGRQFPEEHPKTYDPVTLETPWATGACLWIPRVVRERIGGFDEQFFMYHEDVDYSWRARLAGFSIKLADKALFAHQNFYRSPNPQRDKMFLLTQRQLAHKWGDDTFRKLIENRLITAGLISDKGQLEPLPVRGKLPQGSDHIVDFSTHYAPARW